MEFHMRINCNTPAFKDNERREVARILIDTVARVVAREEIRGELLKDRHGNMVGTYEFNASSL